MKQLSLETRDQWRKWLARHHRREDGVWLVFHKKATGKPTLDYDAVVEEALCFGWIDSIIKKLDEDTYARKITPRKPNSRWSASNKKRVEKLIKQGRMTGMGLELVEYARESGLWDKPAAPPKVSLKMPPELAEALAKNKKAKAFFDSLAPSFRKQFIGWINMAKRQDTRARRVAEAVTLLGQGQKLGLK